MDRAACAHAARTRESGHAMKFFIDTANLEEIETAKSWGVLAGVTTNPSLYAKIGGKLADFEAHMQKICKVCGGLPVSAESQAKTTEGMIADGRRLAALAPNIVIKLPICEESLPATRTFAEEGIRVNMTLVFSAPPALLAARAGARYISLFIGRFDDIGDDGTGQLEQVIKYVKNYSYDWWDEEGGPEIIAASVRSVNHVTKAALLGADIATVPFQTLRKCIRHPLTVKGRAKFDADWTKVAGREA